MGESIVNALANKLQKSYFAKWLFNISFIIFLSCLSSAQPLMSLLRTYTGMNTVHLNMQLG